MTQPKLPRGRPPVTEAERLKIVTVRLNQSQIDKLHAMGIDTLRKFLDRWRPAADVKKPP